MKPTCYQLRRESDGLKVIGGSVPNSCKTLDEAAAWLTEKSEVAVSLSGRAQFLYGRTPVWVTLTVDAANSDKGKAAELKWQEEKRNREDAIAEINNELERELEDLVSEIGIEAVLRKLKGSK